MTAARDEPSTRRPGGSGRAPLVLTMGDPAGIGPELALDAWLARHEAGLSPFVMIADRRVLAGRAEATGRQVPIVVVSAAADAAVAFGNALPVLDLPLAADCIAGRPDPANGAAVIAAIELAVALVEAGEVSAIVTNPIAKQTLYAAGFTYPGHTEFLAALAERRRPGTSIRPVMMLACDELRVVPLTIHIPVIDVPRAITRSLILETVRITAAGLVRDFAIANPRIAVCGLNPHAGEGGAIGREEIEIIAPAVAELARQGIAVTGPHSADTLFHAAARRGYDAVVAMYHDQALIPIKTIAFDEGVNVTLGLPFIRTSPDHGTAFDIAGTGRARPASLIAALRLAGTLAARRNVRAAPSRTS